MLGIWLRLLVVGWVAHGARPVGGWNDRIGWTRLSDGLRQARAAKKPLLVLIYQSSNGACKALKPQWVKSKEIEQLSSHFVMVNAGDSEEPKDQKFRPEGVSGGYYPRLIFLRPDGSRIDAVQGPSAQHKAYYSKPAQIITSMKAALLSVGVDLDADSKAEKAAAEKAEREAAEAYRNSVPGMLEAIFAIVDSDRNQKLSHPEFAMFIKHSKGQVPTPVQYERMCKMHKSEGGLTFEKMREVYASRSADELRKLHDKLLTARTGHAEL